MKIIVGLGNIGEKYLKTRHNCGFLVLDEFVKQIGNDGFEITWKEDAKLKAIISKFNYDGQEILLAKPITLMNNSGESINKIINFYKETPDNLIMIYDDIDLPLGNIRIRKKGSAGTHNGVRSVIQALNSENFQRIRIGIESRGALTAKQQDLHSYVLTNFTKQEYSLIDQSIKTAVTELKKMLK